MVTLHHWYRRNRGAHMHENCTPSHHLHLRQITTSQVLTACAAGRTAFAAAELARSVVVGIDRKQIELFAAEVNWLTIPGVDEKEDGEEKTGGASCHLCLGSIS